LLYEELIY